MQWWWWMYGWGWRVYCLACRLYPCPWKLQVLMLMHAVLLLVVVVVVEGTWLTASLQHLLH